MLSSVEHEKYFIALGLELKPDVIQYTMRPSTAYTCCYYVLQTLECSLGQASDNCIMVIC